MVVGRSKFVANFLLVLLFFCQCQCGLLFTWLLGTARSDSHRGVELLRVQRLVILILVVGTQNGRCALQFCRCYWCANAKNGRGRETAQNGRKVAEGRKAKECEDEKRNTTD